LRLVGRPERPSSSSFGKCVKGSSRIPLSKTSPTHSRNSFRTLGLLTLTAALSLSAESPSLLKPVESRDSKVVRRWSVTGGPRGVAVANGVIYLGLADRQSVLAIDSKTGRIINEAVLDHAEIAATKELVTMRTNAARNRLYIAHGSDESATILSLPDMGVIREITIEGESVRDVIPDPKGRFVYVLGRRLHVYGKDGNEELRTIDFNGPMAAAVTSNGASLAILGTHDFGNAKATVVALYDTTTFAETAREPLQTDKVIDAALFAAGDSALVALSRDYLYEKPVLSRTPRGMESSGGQMRMRIDFGDLVNSERICLPEESGPQIAVLGATPDQLLYAERRCSNSGAFAGSSRKISPASLYGVNAYALAYDAASNTLVATDKAGFLTIYKVPRAAIAK